MNIWTFAAENPVTSVVLALLMLLAVQVVCQTIFQVINRNIRSRNIAAQGWPPPHLDADGDFKPDPRVDE